MSSDVNVDESSDCIADERVALESDVAVDALLDGKGVD
jgi:hypothetical protein